jgi:hypothetical protein
VLYAADPVPPSDDIPARTDDAEDGQGNPVDTRDGRRKIAWAFGALLALWIGWYGVVWIHAKAVQATPPARNVCTSSCRVFVATECPTHRFIGACGEIWRTCDTPVETHTCL